MKHFLLFLVIVILFFIIILNFINIKNEAFYVDDNINSNIIILNRKIRACPNLDINKNNKISSFYL
jgi:hypothetical protein